MVSSLAYYVMQLRKEFTNYCKVHLQEIGLSQGQLFFILFIGKHPECSPKEVALALQMDNAHVVRSLVKLEQGGFLEQSVNPADHRAHILKLRERGEEAFQFSYELFDCWDQAIMQDLPKEEQKELLRILKTLEAQPHTEKGREA